MSGSCTRNRSYAAYVIFRGSTLPYCRDESSIKAGLCAVKAENFGNYSIMYLRMNTTASTYMSGEILFVLPESR